MNILIDQKYLNICKILYFDWNIIRSNKQRIKDNMKITRGIVQINQLIYILKLHYVQFNGAYLQQSNLPVVGCEVAKVEKELIMVMESLNRHKVESLKLRNLVF